MRRIIQKARRLIPAHAGKTLWSKQSRAASPAHPRSRGENCSARSATICLSGSSPLTRGKLRRGIRRFKKERLIPAHAGKTPCGAARRAGTPAHPRSRGENYKSATLTRSSSGSSPLTRGKRRRIDPVPETVGLIPAHAGKTRPKPLTRTSSPAHPRSRGENGTLAVQDLCATGSSPLTQGKLVRFAPGKVHQGLIPAHAGKTSSFSWLLRRSAAHPRSRGENSRVVMMVPFRGGSSPLTRGKLRHLLLPPMVPGLIPAHAGKTDSCRPSCRIHRAQPRSRGENILTRKCASIWRGSSPLTRGKPSCGHVFVLARGLIPAHAGKTCPGGRAWARPGAHPRSRGENFSATSIIRKRRGSSPLTRGKLLPSLIATLDGGLIPAHAGKTRAGRSEAKESEAHPRSRGENGVVPGGIRSG